MPALPSVDHAPWREVGDDDPAARSVRLRGGVPVACPRCQYVFSYDPLRTGCPDPECSFEVKQHAKPSAPDTVHPALYSCGRPDCHVDTPHAHLTIDPTSPLLGGHEKPPTDPPALAAWLYARVVPGVWAEWADSDGDPYGGPVAQKHFRDGRLWLWAGRDSSAIIMPTRGNIETSCRLVRLLNPDGTVLWEAT